MHNYEHKVGSNILNLIHYFQNYGYRSDGYDDETAYPNTVNFMSKVFNNTSDAIEATQDNSYWGGTSISISRVVPSKTTKAFDNAYKGFIDKRKEYLTFKNSLNIAYGRSSSRVTCPNCKSVISLNYGKFHKQCPVCGSQKIISDSNWKTLDTKKGMMEKASTILEREAHKCDITFVAAIGWHS